MCNDINGSQDEACKHSGSSRAVLAGMLLDVCQLCFRSNIACPSHNTGHPRLQGMNFIAGALLLFMDEEVVFWALATIVEDLLPGYFAQDLVAAQVDQLVFKHMVRVACVAHWQRAGPLEEACSPVLPVCTDLHMTAP